MLESYNPYQHCKTEEDFERTRRFINLIIWTTMGPIKAQEFIDKERVQCSHT